MTTQDGWIRLEDYCEQYNERRGTVHKRVTDGTWERGVIFASPDGLGGACFVHEERAKAWLDEKGRAV